MGNIKGSEEYLFFRLKHNSCSKEIWKSAGNGVQNVRHCLFMSLVALVSKLQYNKASVKVALDNKTIHVEVLVFTLWSSGFLFWISSSLYLGTWMPVSIWIYSLHTESACSGSISFEKNLICVLRDVIWSPVRRNHQDIHLKTTFLIQQQRLCSTAPPSAIALILYFPTALYTTVFEIVFRQPKWRAEQSFYWVVHPSVWSIFFLQNFICRAAEQHFEAY